MRGSIPPQATPSKHNTKMEEGPSLQQYSTQLNVYDPTEAHRGRLFVNYSDQFEISYKTGLGPVVIQALHYQEGIGDSPHNLVDKLYEMTAATESEATRATASEGILSSAISTERTRAQAEEKKSSDGLASEVSARSSAVTAQASALAQEIADRITAVSALNNSLANELVARAAADTVHSTTIAANTTFIINESKRADDEEKRIVGLVTAEADARHAVDLEILEFVRSNNTRALAAEAILLGSINDLSSIIDSNVAQSLIQISASVAVETAARSASELALTGRIDAVLSNIDAAALDSFTEVVTALQGSGAGGLAGAINTADSRALAAEASLQAQISALLAAVLALQAPY